MEELPGAGALTAASPLLVKAGGGAPSSPRAPLSPRASALSDASSEGGGDASSSPGSSRPRAARRACPRAWASASTCGVAAVCALSLLQLALVAWDLATHLSDPLILYWAASALFVAATVPLALYDIHCHLVRFVSPLQRFYVRILLLLPIYTVESWLALRFEGQALYLTTLRDLYEAFVIHAFFQLLLQFLGDRERLKERLAARGAFVNVSLFPYGIAPLERFACAPPDAPGGSWLPCIWWPSGGTFLFRCEFGVYQYVVVKCVLTVAFFAASVAGTLGEDTPYAYQSFWPWWSWIILFSQVWAITCLVLFYESTWRWLAPLKPLHKFVCVKGMVFVTWAQGELISVRRANTPRAARRKRRVPRALQAPQPCARTHARTPHLPCVARARSRAPAVPQGPWPRRARGRARPRA